MEGLLKGMELANDHDPLQLLRPVFDGHGARLMVVMAHPDDETVALGGRLNRLGNATFLYVTDGAPRDGYDARQHGFESIEEYRSARRDELARALSVAGIPEGHSIQLDIPDQQAIFHLSSIVDRIGREIEKRQPAAVLTHPYEGGHPDHDACAAAVDSAVAQISKDERPVIIEGCFYHAGQNGIETGCFLPSSEPQMTCTLNDTERRLKRDLLSAFTTQQQTLQYFGSEVERYRLAPRYDFTAPPHAGKLFYEYFDWGVTGAEFRARVIELQRETRVCA
jgi:LmbE family N-acetylglucosaminyl deacetylase